MEQLENNKHPNLLARRRALRNAMKAALEGDPDEVRKHNIEALIYAPPLVRDRAMRTIDNLSLQAKESTV